MTSSLAALIGGASDLAVVQSPLAQPSLASAGSVEATSAPAAIVTFSSAAVAAPQYESWATTINDPNASDDAKAAAYAAFTATSTAADVHFGYSTESELDMQFWKEVGHSTFMTVNLGAAQNAYSSVEKNYFDANGWGPGLDEAGLSKHSLLAATCCPARRKHSILLN